MSIRVPKRGELGFLDFNPQSGVEQAGRRPCLVLSPESFNQATGLAIVCPIRTHSGDWPFEIEVPQGLKIEGFILTDQVKSIDWRARKYQMKDEVPQETTQQCLDIIHTFLS